MTVDDLASSFDLYKDESSLRRLVTDKIKEGLYLEFKLKEESNNGKLSEQDKKNFSKTISAFANSDGGILLWGIETSKKDESAKKLKPINQVDQFIKSLKSFLLYVTQPVVDGILVEKISKKGSKTKGYVKCLIPSSFKAPHRAIDREYYKRSVEGVYRLEHFDLEDMFGRRARPDLKLHTEIKVVTENNEQFNELRFYLKNEGRAIARYYGIYCAFGDNMELISAKFPFQDVSELNNRPTVSFTDNSGVIHPNNITSHIGTILFKFKNPKISIAVAAKYYCEHMATKEETFAILPLVRS